MPSSSLTVLASIRPSVPPALAAKLEAWDPASTPATPRRSASVVLIRSSGAAASDNVLEVYLLQRHARMAFAASMAVFPGGGIDPVDDGPDPVLACAVRETHEETGVRLDPATLRRWAHWITPEVEPRRFDTHFFVATLPDGEEAQDVSGETDSAGWWTPTAALSAAARGELGLMPPTLSILTELAEARTVAAVLALAADRAVTTVLPRAVRDDAGWRFCYPEPPR